MFDINSFDKSHMDTKLAWNMCYWTALTSLENKLHFTETSESLKILPYKVYIHSTKQKQHNFERLRVCLEWNTVITFSHVKYFMSYELNLPYCERTVCFELIFLKTI